MDELDLFNFQATAPFTSVDYNFGSPSSHFSTINQAYPVSVTGSQSPRPGLGGNPTSTIEEQKGYMQSIIDIFELSEEEEEEPDDGDDDMSIERPIDLEAQQRRTEKLRGVRSALDRLWWSNSEFMSDAAEKLADGSRDRKFFLVTQFFSLFCSRIFGSAFLLYSIPGKHGL
jgi:hypothetical protein